MKNIKISFAVRPTGHQIRYASLLAAGMRKHGYNNIHIGNPLTQEQIDSDLLIFWAAKRDSVIKSRKQQGKRTLIMERAYIGDRFDWMSLGYDGLNGRADFCNKGKDGTRWNKYFSQYMLPWKENNGKYALVVGQVLGDAAVRHVNIQDWYKKTISELNALGYEVVFREHPQNKMKWTNNSSSLKYTLDTNEKLEDTLKDAKCCVTFSSNSGVISVLSGIPTISHDVGSMVYNVSSHSVSQSLITPDRTQWANEIAWCQWLPEELENGEAWEHIKQGITR
jgi:hypothetical protein